MSVTRWNGNGGLEYLTFDVHETVHLINLSIAPDQITKKQFNQLITLVIPRIRREDVRLQNEEPVPIIIAYFPKRSVSEIKNIADCDLASSSPLQITSSIEAMLEYRDILMYGLKNVDINEKKAFKYYDKALNLGYPEAFIAVAIVMHYSLILKFPKQILQL